MDALKKVTDAVEFLKTKTDYKPKIGLVLGSGFGDFAKTLRDSVCIGYNDIPGFTASGVSGHSNRLYINSNVICMQGRIHLYEGNSIKDVCLPIRVMKLLGAEILIVTNAAGGINKMFSPGDLMLINDHINLMCTNPLIGKNYDELGTRFPDMSEAYDKELLAKIKRIAYKFNISVQEGVYAAVSGPCYETPAEVRMLRVLGADAVGMSTVPEVIAANHMGMRVVGFSIISNMAAGIMNNRLFHNEVLEVTEKIRPQITVLLEEVINELSGK